MTTLSLEDIELLHLARGGGHYVIVGYGDYLRAIDLVKLRCGSLLLCNGDNYFRISTFGLAVVNRTPEAKMLDAIRESDRLRAFVRTVDF